MQLDGTKLDAFLKNTDRVVGGRRPDFATAHIGPMGGDGQESHRGGTSLGKDGGIHDDIVQVLTQYTRIVA